MQKRKETAVQFGYSLFLNQDKQFIYSRISMEGSFPSLSAGRNA